jgi:hypothetical protein
MTNAVTIAQGGSSGIPTGLKNYVINGNMRIDQRYNGALMTYTTASSSFRGLDRFYAINYVGTGGQISSTQQRVAVTDLAVPHDFALRMTVGNTSGRTVFDGRFQHNIEGNMISDLRFGSSNADPLSASFWIRASKEGRAQFTMFNDGVGTQVQFYKSINITTSWQYITISIPPCTISGAGIQRGNTRAFGTGIYWATSGYNTNTAVDGTWQTSWTSNSAVDDFTVSGNWIEMTGYQIEKGSSATGFDYRPHTLELLLCYRYFETVKFGVHSPAVATSTSYSADRPFPMGSCEFKAEKRTSPSITISSGQTRTLNQVSGYSSGSERTVSSFSGADTRRLCTYIQLTSNTNAFEQQLFYYDADADL